MIFAIRLFDTPAPSSARERRTLRLRNRVQTSPYLRSLQSGAAQFAEILSISLRKGVAAARRIAVPAACIQAVMLTVALSYFYYPAASGLFASLLNWRGQVGPLQFSFLSMGTIAVFAEFLNRKSPGNSTATKFAANSAFGFMVFGCLGVITDLFYSVQSHVWGGLSASAQIPAKVLTDQLLYTVLFANPYQTFLYVLKDCGFRRSPFRHRITPFKTFYVREVLAVLITNWAFWIPTTCILYSLPLDLQFVISRFAILIWVLLLSSITGKDSQ